MDQQMRQLGRTGRSKAERGNFPDSHFSPFWINLDHADVFVFTPQMAVERACHSQSLKLRWKLVTAKSATEARRRAVPD